MSFFWPEAFLLLIPYIALIYYRKKKFAFPFSSLRNIIKTPSSFRASLSILPEFFLHLSFLFLLIALARPQEATEVTQRHIEGIDIIVSLDVSESMLIEDMDPNRLEASKIMIEKFIHKKVSARIGLVIFSGESFSPVPMTLDYPLLIEKLTQVTENIKLKAGTAIGLALLNSVDRLKKNKKKNRIIIFLTDGENNSGNIAPEVALDFAKKYKVKIYTIAMGTGGPARIPTIVKSASGRLFKRYRPYVSRVNKELLKKMSKETGGLFFEATSSDVLENIFEKISSLEKSKLKTESLRRVNELFHNFLLLSFFFYLLSVLLGDTILRRLG